MRAAMALAIGLLGLALGRMDPVLAATQGEALMSEIAPESARLTLVWPRPAAVSLTVVGRVAALDADQPVALVPADRLAALADWLDGATSTGDGRSLLLKLRRGVRASLDRPHPRMAVIALVRTPPVQPPVLARLPAIAVEPAAGPARLPPIPVSRPAVEAEPVATLPATAPSVAAPSSDPPGRSRVIVSAEPGRDGLKLRFRWGEPVPAAIFRRGDRLWVAFPDDEVEVAGWRSLDRPELAGWLQPLGTAAVAGVRSFRLRMTRPAEIRAEPEANGWSVALFPPPGGGPRTVGPVVLQMDRAAGTLAAPATGQVAQLRDPDSGERLGLLMTAEAMQETGSARLVDLELLPSAQGLVWRVLADGVRAAVSDGRLIVSRPGGLRLAPGEPTSASAPRPRLPVPSEPEAIAAPRQDAGVNAATAPLGLSVPAVSTATIRDEERRRIVEGLPALAGLPRAEARLALARLYLADALGPEARTALELIEPGDIASPGAKAQRLSNLALSGVADALAGRADPALGKLLDHALDDDREVALWRAYAATLAARRDLAGQEWARSGGVPDGYPDPLRRRLGLELAAMLLEGVDPAAATALLERLKGLVLPPDEAARLQLLQGSALAKAGDAAGADKAYAAAAAGDADTAVRAAFLSTEQRLAGGVIPAAQALAELDAQRLRWRGHSWEGRMLDRLAKLQAGQGEAVAAIATWREAVARSGEPDAAAARSAALRRQLKAVLADGTQPAVLRLALNRSHGDMLADDPEAPRLRRQLAETASGLGLADTAARLIATAGADGGAARAEPVTTFQLRRAAAAQRGDWSEVATLAEAELAEGDTTGPLPPAKAEAAVWLALAQTRLGRLPAAASTAERYRGRIEGATEQALLGLATLAVPPATAPGALAEAEAGFAAALKAGLATLPALRPTAPVRTAAAR